MVWWQAILCIIFGVAITIWSYETFLEHKEKEIEGFISIKMVKLLEECSIRIKDKEKELERHLTEEEKNVILDQCYNDI